MTDRIKEAIERARQGWPLYCEPALAAVEAAHDCAKNFVVTETLEQALAAFADAVLGPEVKEGGDDD